MSNSTPNFPKLNNYNYRSWSGDMQAWLMSKELWMLVDGEEPCPPSTDEESKLKWSRRAQKAAGELYLSVEQDQKSHFHGMLSDPIRIWTTLRDVHMSKKPGARFNAYDSLFSIRKQPNESLQSLCARIDTAMQNIQDLRPTAFILKDLDDELHSMALIRSLPDEYKSLSQSLMLLDDLNKNTIREAFLAEETNSRKRGEQDIPQTSDMALYSSNSSKSEQECDFCGFKGHTSADCRKLVSARAYARKPRPAKKQTANSANVEPESSKVAESAGNASDNHISSFPLQIDANFDWNADSGATSHMTPHAHWMRNYTPFRTPIRLANNHIVYSAGVGSVVFVPTIGGKGRRAVEFTRVLHVPDLKTNLLSILYLTRHKQFTVTINSCEMRFIHEGTLLFTAQINENNAAFLDGSTDEDSHTANFVSTLPVDISLWHRRLAHHDYNSVKQMITRRLVTGIDIQSKQPPDLICEPCLSGKMNAHPFPSSTTRATKPLELIHSDLHGPFRTRTISGYRYWITFIDDYTSFRAVMFLKAKSEAFDAFRRYKAYAENHLGRKILCMRIDKGGEYMSKAFIDYTLEHGITRQYTVRARPQQNGVAERANRTIQEHVVAMLNESGLPPSFLGQAVAAYVHIWNRCSTTRLTADTTPYELWHRKKPDVSHLRVFGCTAYVHIQKDKRTGIGSHMEKCIFVGYPQGYKGWTFYNPTTKRTIISERAEFDERYFPGLKQAPLTPEPFEPLPPIVFNPVPDSEGDSDAEDAPANPPHPQRSPLPDLPPNIPDNAPSRSPSPDPPPDAPPDATVLNRQSPLPDPPDPSLNLPIAFRRERRQVKAPGNWWVVDRKPTPAASESEDEEENEEFAGAAHDLDPRSLKQALARSDGHKWQEAAKLEMESHKSNGTWELIDLPPGAKTIGSGWVFRLKRNADGSIERYKARLVAKGYSQRPGFDYTEVFAPTFRYAAIRTIIALAAVNNLHLRSVDISHAFLNGDLEETIYMRQAEGFHMGSSNQVYRLRKSLYGLKQAARQWNKKLHDTLCNMGFKRLESDRSIYIFLRGDVRIIIPIFIDDITFASSNSAAIDSTVKELSSHFKLRDLGPTSFLLGIEIIRNHEKRQISLSQRQYIIDALDRFNMSDCNPIGTPMDPGAHLSSSMSPQSPEEQKVMDKIPYLSAVGTLQYLATSTRPDISFAVGVLARFNCNPGIQHWSAVKHLFRYLKGTLDYKLVYGPTDSSELFITYTDADHGGNLDNGRSTGGYAIVIGGGAVSWSSRLQPIVALSTTEAEYVAATEAGKELIWMRNLLNEFGYTHTSASHLLIDNNSAVTVSKNPEHHGRMKHLDLRFFWLRDNVEAGLITPIHIPTTLQAADIFTKPLKRQKIDVCLGLLGIQKK
jgi:transposase InsO family protein